MAVMHPAIVILVVVLSTAYGADRPSVDDVARFGRWLVRQGRWGVIATNTPSATPFAYPASYTDDGNGFPLFYFSRFDPVGMDVQADVRCSFSVTELSFNGCQGTDPQSPACSKITLLGQLRVLAANSNEESRAKAVLFNAHPSFTGFPSGNGTFSVYTLEIENIFLVNKPAPARSLTVEDYLAAEE